MRKEIAEERLTEVLLGALRQVGEAHAEELASTLRRLGWNVDAPRARGALNGLVAAGRLIFSPRRVQNPTPGRVCFVYRWVEHG